MNICCLPLMKENLNDSGEFVFIPNDWMLVLLSSLNVNSDNPLNLTLEATGTIGSLRPNSPIT